MYHGHVSIMGIFTHANNLCFAAFCADAPLFPRWVLAPSWPPSRSPPLPPPAPPFTTGLSILVMGGQDGAVSSGDAVCIMAEVGERQAAWKSIITITRLPYAQLVLQTILTTPGYYHFIIIYSKTVVSHSWFTVVVQTHAWAPRLLPAAGISG